jgi:hypothetical protein
MPIGCYLSSIVYEQSELYFLTSVERMISPLTSTAVSVVTSFLMTYTQAYFKPGGDVRLYFQSMAKLRKKANTHRKKSKRFDDTEHVAFVIAGILKTVPALTTALDAISSYAADLANGDGWMNNAELQLVYDRIFTAVSNQFPNTHLGIDPSGDANSATGIGDANYVETSANAARAVAQVTCQLCGRFNHVASECRQFSISATGGGGGAPKTTVKTSTTTNARRNTTSSSTGGWNENRRLCAGTKTDVKTGKVVHCKDDKTNGFGQHMDSACPWHVVSKTANLVHAWAYGDSSDVTHVQHGTGDVTAIDGHTPIPPPRGGIHPIFAIAALIFAIIVLLPSILAIPSAPPAATAVANLVVAYPVEHQHLLSSPTSDYHEPLLAVSVSIQQMVRTELQELFDSSGWRWVEHAPGDHVLRTVLHLVRKPWNTTDFVRDKKRFVTNGTDCSDTASHVLDSQWLVYATAGLFVAMLLGYLLRPRVVRLLFIATCTTPVSASALTVPTTITGYATTYFSTVSSPASPASFHTALIFAVVIIYLAIRWLLQPALLRTAASTATPNPSHFTDRILARFSISKPPIVGLRRRHTPMALPLFLLSFMHHLSCTRRCRGCCSVPSYRGVVPTGGALRSAPSVQYLHPSSPAPTTTSHYRLPAYYVCRKTPRMAALLAPQAALRVVS